MKEFPYRYSLLICLLEDEEEREERIRRSSLQQTLAAMAQSEREDAKMLWHDNADNGNFTTSAAGDLQHLPNTQLITKEKDLPCEGLPAD